MIQSSRTRMDQAAARRVWLSSLMLREPGRWSSRLGALVSWLKMIGRGQRRRLARAAASTVAGASGIALMALLAGPMGQPWAALPVAAASIDVNGTTCTLVDAIIAANTDTPTGGCTAGDGADTIILSGDVTLSNKLDNATAPFSFIGLPLIESVVTIQSSPGNKFTIARSDAAADRFRLMSVSPTGNLTLRNVTLSNGYAYLLYDDLSVSGNGGAIFAEGHLTLDGVTLSENSALIGGGALDASDATITVTNSIITGNTSISSDAGGMRLLDTEAAISETAFISNTAQRLGGAILARRGGVSVTNSLITDNRAGSDGGGVHIDDAITLISGVTISGNVAQSDGGGIDVDAGDVTIINSTISGNASTGSDGGGLGVDGGVITITHSTFTDNYAYSEGGGIYSDGGVTRIYQSIISGNRESGNSDNEIDEDSGDISVYNSVLGHAGQSYSEAFSSITLHSSNIIATSDYDDIDLEAILETTLADNGGPALPGGYKMLTHNLVKESPAIDIVDGTECEPGTTTNGVDQRGRRRPKALGCDAGAIEFTPFSVLVSTWAAGTVDGLSYGPADILQWDGDSWTTWFTGTAAGLDPTGKWKHNLNAIWISDAEIAEFAVSFVQNQQRIGDLGWVDGYDILMWDGDVFSRWFEGEKVGLNNKTQEKIDGLHVLSAVPEWSEFSGETCEAYLLISTQGPGLVPKPGNVKPKNVLKFSGEDALGFCATNLGPNTTGFWEMALDGSADGVKRNNVDSISMNEDGSVLYLTSKKAFAVDGALGGHSEVYAFDLAAEKRGELRKVSDGDFSGPLFSIYDAGMDVNAKLDALEVSGELEMP